MPDSWCVSRLASNDHEPLIAHPGSYDADRCIHRNDHGQPRGRIAPAGKQAAVLAVVVTIAKGYDLGYIWKTQDHAAEPHHRRVLHQRRPGRGTARPLVGTRSPGPRPHPRPDRPARAVRRGLPADRPAHRRQARPAPRPLPHVRRPPGPAAGGRAARHRRTAHRAGTRGRPGHPAARRLLRRHRLVLQVHLGAARLHPGERAPRPPGRRPAGRRVLGRAGAGVPGDPAPGQPGRAGVLCRPGPGSPAPATTAPGSTAASRAGSSPPG